VTSKTRQPPPCTGLPVRMGAVLLAWDTPAAAQNQENSNMTKGPDHSVRKWPGPCCFVRPAGKETDYCPPEDAVLSDEAAEEELPEVLSTCAVSSRSPAIHTSMMTDGSTGIPASMRTPFSPVHMTTQPAANSVL